MTATKPTRKATRPSQRRYYAEYHYPDQDSREVATPWADAVDEYTRDEVHQYARANGDDE